MMIPSACEHRGMSIDPNAGLADRLVETVLVRFVIKRSGELVQGEVVSVGGETIGRFRDWPQVSQVISAWAARARIDE